MKLFSFCLLGILGSVFMYPDLITTTSMRELGLRAAAGQVEAITQLERVYDALYKDIDVTKEQDRVATNLILMRAAFDEMGKSGAQGNETAYKALYFSLGKLRLNEFAASGMGIVAAAGNRAALDILLHPVEHGISRASQIWAMRYPAEKNIPEAVDFLIGVMQNDNDIAYWDMASKALVMASHLGNQDATQVLLDYENFLKTGIKKHSKLTGKIIPPKPKPAEPPINAEGRTEQEEANHRMLLQLADQVLKGDKSAIDKMDEFLILHSRHRGAPYPNERTNQDERSMVAATNIIFDAATKGQQPALEMLIYATSKLRLSAWTIHPLCKILAEGNPFGEATVFQYREQGYDESVIIEEMLAQAEADAPGAVRIAAQVLKTKAYQRYWDLAYKALLIPAPQNDVARKAVSDYEALKKRR